MVAAGLGILPSDHEKCIQQEARPPAEHQKLTTLLHCAMSSRHSRHFDLSQMSVGGLHSEIRVHRQMQSQVFSCHCVHLAPNACPKYHRGDFG